MTYDTLEFDGHIFYPGEILTNPTRSEFFLVPEQNTMFHTDDMVIHIATGRIIDIAYAWDEYGELKSVLPKPEKVS